MNNGTRCLVLSMNLLNWGMYGRVAEPKVRKVCDVIAESRPQVLCLSEVGPDDAVAQLAGPLEARGLRYVPVSVGKPNSRGIRNAILAQRGVEILTPRLIVPMEMTLPEIRLESFEMGGMKLRLSREPLAVLVRVEGTVLAIGFFHPKSKYPEDYRTGRMVEAASVPNQTFLGACKMVSSLRNFGQCLLAREFVDRFYELNPLPEGVAQGEVRFVLVGDWNANPQEEQRHALSGYLDASMPPESLLIDCIGRASTDMRDICTIPWGGAPNSFDAIYIDKRLEDVSEARIIPVDPVDFFAFDDKERERLENEVLDHCPVGLYLK